MNRLEKLQSLCKQRGITINKLEQELGMPQSSLQKIGQSVPKADRLYKVAQYFDVPMEYFFDDDERLDYYYEKIQGQIENYLNGISKPVYRASAGQGAYNDTYTADSISMGEEGYEYAEVVGDSMLPELRDGDVIKIEPTSQTSPRDYTLIKIDGEDCTVKFVEVVDNGIWVRALNKEVFADRFYTIQDVLTLPITIIGKVVAFRRTFQ